MQKSLSLEEEKMDYLSYSMVSKLTVLLWFITSSVCAQTDTLNQTNVRGQKVGFWRVYHKTHPKSRHYEGRYVAGKKSGKFKYYNKQDQLAAHRIYLPKDSSYVYFLDQHQNVMGQGGFRGKKKSGKWVYFDQKKNKLREDTFVAGVLHGVSLLYDKETHQVIIKQFYKKGFQDGPFERYDAHGKLVIQGQYKMGKLHGHTTYFDPKTGYKEIEGKYNNGVRKGTWTFYLGGQESHTEVYP